MAAELFHVGGWKDRRDEARTSMHLGAINIYIYIKKDMMKLTVAFRNFTNAPNNGRSVG